eukprot:gnl/Spiro4/12_TR11_c0_g1_i1.p1 gnl/Spiro4/12_TR11_c0_g1~~gnl/Spiro4/12_TR11_c0_g1_i1.p1  ORF type:complete len:235 (-),score=58.61 gnl/Spiro4/12_TR11_c0_g1_i1:64-723(-)
MSVVCTPSHVLNSSLKNELSCGNASHHNIEKFGSTKFGPDKLVCSQAMPPAGRPCGTQGSVSTFVSSAAPGHRRITSVDQFANCGNTNFLAHRFDDTPKQAKLNGVTQKVVLSQPQLAQGNRTARAYGQKLYNHHPYRGTYLGYDSTGTAAIGPVDSGKSFDWNFIQHSVAETTPQHRRRVSGTRRVSQVDKTSVGHKWAPTVAKINNPSHLHRLPDRF